MAVSALTVLQEIMLDPEKPPAARVSAAARLLENLLKSREASTLSERLARLEEALASGQPRTSLLPPAGGGFQR